MRQDLFFCALVIALSGCGGGESSPSAPPTAAEPTCPSPSIDGLTTPGFPTAAVIERRAHDLVVRDVDPHACVDRVVARRESWLVEASHGGETYRARLAAPSGTPTESLAPHVAAQRLLRSLLEAGVESAVSSGRGVALGFSDHSAACYRTVGQDPQCVRMPAVVAFDTVTEPSQRLLLVRSFADAGRTTGTEWELTLGDAMTLATRSGALDPSRALGTPPPELSRFARVHASASEAAATAPDTAAATIAQTMPTGATTVRLETRMVGATRLALLSRCEGMLAHCVSVVATGSGSALRLAPSFATDPARIDLAEEAPTFAPGAIRVRLLETGFHEGSASELFVTTAGGTIEAREVVLGSETSRGEEESVEEGCYRTLTIEGANRVRLSGAQGWSGTHSDARGWRVVPSTTCAMDTVLCLDPSAGFGPCP